MRDQWYKKYNLPPSDKDLGIGHTSEDISKIRPSEVSDMTNYFDAVYLKMTSFFESKSIDLDDKVAETEKPGVTVIELPEDIVSGVAEVYTNVFTDWPDQGGVPITDEIKASVKIIGVEPVVDPNATPEEQKQSLEKKTDDSFEDLIMKEKPDIKWSECIGLDNAKNALRESIVYPSKRPDLFPLGWPRGMLLYGPPA